MPAQEPPAQEPPQETPAQKVAEEILAKPDMPAGSDPGLAALPATTAATNEELNEGYEQEARAEAKRDPLAEPSTASASIPAELLSLLDVSESLFYPSISLDKLRFC